MNEKKMAWPETETPPLEDTYVFNASVSLQLDHQQERAIQRWLNDTYPEQHAKEVEAFHRQERGEPLFESEEDSKASMDSELVKAHYAFRRHTRFKVKMEVSKDGSIRLLSGYIPSPDEPW